MIRHTVRAGRIVVGIALLLIGVVLSLPLVPGPGFVFIFGGLAVLSSEFEWARRIHDWAHRELQRLTRKRHAR